MAELDQVAMIGQIYKFLYSDQSYNLVRVVEFKFSNNLLLVQVDYIGYTNPIQSWYDSTIFQDGYQYIRTELATNEEVVEWLLQK